MGVVRTDLPTPAPATVADRRGRAPAGNTALGPFAKEAATGTVVDAKVGLTVPMVLRPVMEQVVATRMATAATDHPPVLAPPWSGGVEDLATPDLWS